MKTASGKLFSTLAAALISIVAAGCAESTATGAPVDIPRIFVNCQTTKCRTNITPRIFVSITTSGCTSPDFGGTRSAVVDSILCTSSLGCYGEVLASEWVDLNGLPTTKIPSGTYSICGRVDFNRDFPPEGPDDSTGALDNVSIGAPTAAQFINSWSDL